jgi:hypothetical protein
MVNFEKGISRFDIASLLMEFLLNDIHFNQYLGGSD